LITPDCDGRIESILDELQVGVVESQELHRIDARQLNFPFCQTDKPPWLSPLRKSETPSPPHNGAARAFQ
jgi:hypothetical protein